MSHTYLAAVTDECDWQALSRTAQAIVSDSDCILIGGRLIGGAYKHNNAKLNGLPLLPNPFDGI